MRRSVSVSRSDVGSGRGGRMRSIGGGFWPMVERQMNNRRTPVPVATAILVVMGACCSLAVAAGNPTEFDPGELGQRAWAVPGALPTPPLPEGDGETLTDSSEENPLWRVPVDALHVTRERPLFSPSRRAPMPVVVSAPVSPIRAVVSPTTAEPTLSLLGIVAGKDEGFAVFINTTTHDIVRLKTGEGEHGWVLRSVSGREAVIENDDRTEILKLPPILGVTK